MRCCLLALLVVIGCSQAPEEPTDTRDPIAIQYVGGNESAVHSHPSDITPVITRYRHGESVPVLSKKGDWAEVRTAFGSGWVHQTDLVGADEAASTKENPNTKFAHPPAPVSAPGVHGSIYIEADVNTDGDITNTTILNNTTGSQSLAEQNEFALKRSKFYPITIRGERKPFKYYYRVDY